MGKKEYDRVAVLAADLGSPRVVAAIDKALEEIQQEMLDLLDLRKMAARRHGETAPAPTMPVIQTSTAVEAAHRVGISKANKPKAFEGTLENLVQRYRADERSPYHKLRHATRVHYDTLIKRIIEDYGDERVADLKTQDIERFYEGWMEGGKIAMSNALMTMLRSLVYFGADTLDDPACLRLSLFLHKMRFAIVESRSERLTAQHVKAIAGKAHERGLYSIALAQAFQFDLTLRQKDVIGEWVPVTEPDESDVVDGDYKWLRGLRWEEIDENFVLTHRLSTGRKEIVADLKSAPTVIEELKFAMGPDATALHRSKFPATGPVIFQEADLLPWTGAEFRRQWRKIADAAGVPKNVKNMDSRASGSDEAAD